MSAAPPSRVELTVRALALGGLITLVFTAANVYLGLKVGLTFASSIPAAVISMAILRGFKTATIWENNIVQTVASAAGTLSSVIFVLPGLVMVGWWTGFPFWESFGICAVGGILGVMYSVPLRRALVTESTLPYPEGVAAAEVLKVGAGTPTAEAVAENKLGLVALVWSSIVSAAFQLLIALGIFTGEFDTYGRIGNSSTGIGLGMSLALIGAGHLIGLTVGMAIFGGLVIAWGAAVPILTAIHPIAGATAATEASTIFHTYVRFIGAGTIGISGVWTLVTLIAPIGKGIASSLAASARRRSGGNGALAITEQDIPIGLVTLVSAVLLIPMAILLAAFLAGGVLSSMIVPLVIGAIVYVVIVGFFVAAVCGYMAGLIGSSNSPVSGLAILAVLGVSLILAAFAREAAPSYAPALVAYALFVTATVINVATISNDNLQDLKTGQLVGATPWKQQVSLVVGVIFGAAIIPPVLVVLNKAYGFNGGPHALGAPQATLISTLAKGVIGGAVDWNLIFVGAVVGAVVIAIDEAGRASGRFRFPPLAVGLGIYLPAGTTAPAVIGAIFGALYNRWVSRKANAQPAKRLGVLVASGLITGESLFGVALAGLIYFSNKPTPLQIVPDSFANVANALGGIALFVVPFLVYRWIGLRARNI
ncbi:MAG TPA: oligopeptide transporter, OPT family [Alphaproteobacteria bacterium]|nr:oligopeptide transporter, OPT family [Alphaproteobacteria bacterium]